MQRKKIEFDLIIYDSVDELRNEDLRLMKKAVEAKQNAYAPYSDFKVGAAVLLENGVIVQGNNQENASYPSGLCAERVAIFYAGANYPNVKVKTVAITASSLNYVVSQPVAPCGNCRQVLKEYEVKQEEPIKLLLMGEEGKVYECASIADILPLGFDNTFL